MSTLRFILKAVFTTPPPRPLSNPVYRYGMLVVVLGLLAGWFRLYCTTSPASSSVPYVLLVVILSLLFSHLAYSFRWPPSITVVLRTLCWSWSVFSVFYILYIVYAV